MHLQFYRRCIMQIHLLEKEWDFISHRLSKLPEAIHPGRPRAADRDLFEGILWVLVTGSRWNELPEIYPAKSSCHRRFQNWVNDGSLTHVRKALLRRLKRRHRLHLHEGFIDGSLIRAKKGAH